MCGINGIYSFNNIDNKSILKKDILFMNKIINHRGPDDEGFFISNKLAFGHRRLSIIDISKAGHQPMLRNNGSLVLIFNGEIYNYLELKNDLTSLGHKFSSQSDSEVILAAYQEWGEQCVHKFNGMWAFALFDKRKNKIFISRDRFGVKPIYYYQDENIFYFSSEIKAIAKVKNIKKANIRKIYQYLIYSYRLNDGDTFFENIKELLPGHNLIIKNNNLSIQKYWSLIDNSDDLPCREGFENQYHDILKNAIKIRFRSDVPIAILQSGGIDSSILSWEINNLIKTHEIQQNKVVAYTAAFKNYDGNESRKAKIALKNLSHIQHKIIDINENHLINDIQNFIRAMDEPVQSATSFVHFMIMKEIKKDGFKVVVNGQGADEALGGYGEQAIGYALIDKLFFERKKFFKEFQLANKIIGLPKLNILLQIMKAIFGRRFSSNFRAKYIEKTWKLINPYFHGLYKSKFTNFYLSFKESNLNKHLISQINYFGFNQILQYEDMSSMSQSIEIRSPFIDYRLMEKSFRIPPGMKIKNGITKFILKRIYKKKIPKEIIYQRKNGFNTPFYEWIKDDKFKKFILDLLKNNSFKDSEIITNLEDLYKKVLNNQIQKNEQYKLWRIVNIELWARCYCISNI